MSALDPVPLFGEGDIEPVVAPVLLVLRGPLLKLSLFGVVVLLPDAPMLLLRAALLFTVSCGDAPSLAKPPEVAPVLDVLEVRAVDWQPAAKAAASVTATNAAGRKDGLMSM